jgi:transcriptional regulator with XRE-family HTH domain
MPIPSGETVFKLENHVEVGAQLRAARERATYSLHYAASLVKIVPSQLARIERGEQQYFGSGSRARLEKLASALIPEHGSLVFTEADWRDGSHYRRRRKARKVAPPVKETPAHPHRHGEDARMRRLTEKMDQVRSIITSHKRGIIQADTAMSILASVTEVTG